MHQQRVNQMIKSAEGSAGFLHKITKPTACRGGAQTLEKEEEDARLLDQRGKNGQSTGNLTKVCRTWRTSSSRKKN